MHNHIHLFVHHMWLLSYDSGGANQLWQRCMTHKAICSDWWRSFNATMTLTFILSLFVSHPLLAHFHMSRFSQMQTNVLILWIKPGHHYGHHSPCLCHIPNLSIGTKPRWCVHVKTWSESLFGSLIRCLWRKDQIWQQWKFRSHRTSTHT